MVSERSGLTADEAASIGQDALIWLAGQPEALAGFLAASGLAPDDAARPRRRPGIPWLRSGIPRSAPTQLVLAFAADAGLDPAAPVRARAALPGGAVPNWT